jgi:hypothetical protein
MTPEFQRPKWEIDKRLESLIGENIRVRASAFCPPRWNGEAGVWIEAENFILPDNSSVDGETFYLEGKLLSFERQVSIVSVCLDRPDSEDTARGRMVYRGQSSVILPGPALVKLRQDHFVERIATDPRSYWNQLKDSGPQLTLPFEE